MDHPKFSVAVTDRQSAREHTIDVAGPNICNQEEAELHVFTMPRAGGGGHPGFEIKPKDAEKFAKLAADRQINIEEGK